MVSALVDLSEQSSRNGSQEEEGRETVVLVLQQGIRRREDPRSTSEGKTLQGEGELLLER